MTAVTTTSLIVAPPGPGTGAQRTEVDLHELDAAGRARGTQQAAPVRKVRAPAQAQLTKSGSEPTAGRPVVSCSSALAEGGPARAPDVLDERAPCRWLLDGCRCPHDVPACGTNPTRAVGQGSEHGEPTETVGEHVVGNERQGHDAATRRHEEANSPQGSTGRHPGQGQVSESVQQRPQAGLGDGPGAGLSVALHDHAVDARRQGIRVHPHPHRTSCSERHAHQPLSKAGNGCRPLQHQGAHGIRVRKSRSVEHEEGTDDHRHPTTPVDRQLEHVIGAGTVDQGVSRVPHTLTVCPARAPRSAGECVDDRHGDEDAEHAQRHATPEQRGHRAGSGTGASDRSGAGSVLTATRTRGRRCDS